MKLTVGKLILGVLIIIPIINRIIYQIIYSEIPIFDGGPSEHGVYTIITALSFTVSWIATLLVIINIICDYWDKPLKF